MKILLINFQLTFGGAERILSSFANFLVKDKNVDVHIVLLNKNIIDYELDNRIKLIEPDFKYKKGTINKIRYSIKIFFYLRKIVHKVKPNKTLTFASPTFVLLSIGKITEVVFSVRCNPQKDKILEGFKFPKFIRKFAYKRAKKVIAQTTFAENYLKKDFPFLNTVTVGNFLSPQIVRLKSSTKENIILYVGRLQKSKGIDILIQSFLTIKKSDWKLVIVGDGPERKSLELLASRSENTIEFMGSVSDVGFYYNISRIFAFPSLSEGFPNALLEAMSIGLICLSFDCIAGPSDLIENGYNGFLVENGNSNVFTEKLEYIVYNIDKLNEIGLRATQLSTKHSQNVVAEKFFIELTR